MSAPSVEELLVQNAELKEALRVAQLPSYVRDLEAYAALCRENKYGRHPFPRLKDIAHRTLRGVNMSGADFTGKDLTSVSFEEADVSGACFRDAVLTKARFRAAILKGATFQGARLDGAEFDRVRACEFDASGADFTGSQWHGADFLDAPFGVPFGGGTDLMGARNYLEVHYGDKRCRLFRQSNGDHLMAVYYRVQRISAWRAEWVSPRQQRQLELMVAMLEACAA
jgi:hypothetical protein